MRTVLPATLVAVALSAPAAAMAAATFDPRVITFGAARQQLQSTPIEQRPNRPLHVYGNTVRRRHDRTVAPRATGRRPTRPESTAP